MVQREFEAALQYPLNRSLRVRRAMHEAWARFVQLGVFDPNTGEPVTPITDEISLQEERDLESAWQLQSRNFIDLGFHTELRLTEEVYLASLPKFEPLPLEYEGRFSIPLIVETRIPWVRQAELAGIEFNNTDLKYRLHEVKPAGRQLLTLDGPYTGWFNNPGERYRSGKTTVDDARRKLRQDEVGAGPCEGIAMYLAHPEIFDNLSLDLIGCKFAEDLQVVFIARSTNGKPFIGIWGDDTGGYLLVRGSRVVTKLI